MVNLTEHQAVDLLEAHGFETYVPPKAKYREQDVFGLYDVLAFGHGVLWGIQVKGGQEARGINHWMESARVFDEHIEGFRSGFLHRKDGAWRFAVPGPEGWQWVYDGRDNTDLTPRDLGGILKR